jgi:AraC family transcriptional regulator
VTVGRKEAGLARQANPSTQNQIKLRIDAARRLLRLTKNSVITIANEVGYSDPSHFAQLFRKETGLAPTDYRRER